MAHYTYDDNTFDMRTKFLMERLHSYFDEVNSWSNRGEEKPMPLFKLKALLLIAEIYEYVRQYINNHENELSDYFGECTLKKCLENVVAVEELQKYLNDIRPDLDYCDAWSDHFMNVVGVSGHPSGYNEYALLHEKGIDSFWGEEANDERPHISRSLLWNATSIDDNKYKFGKLFIKAKESLDDKNERNLSPDPEDHPYNSVRYQRGLAHRIAYKAKKLESFTYPSKQGDFDFLDYLLDIQRKAEDATSDTVCIEMGKSLEILRNVFMAEAEDIYYIRTGDFANLKKSYDEDVIEYLYTELPFKKYNEARSLFVNGSNNAPGLLDDMEVALDEWRISRGYIGRKLSNEEYDEFLQERKDGVIENMKSYEELWKLRMHSGGLDSGVTPENFARMFYRRKGVDRYFIELQWELEELTSLIAKNKQKPAKDSQKLVQTPEQKAVADFVDSIIMLVNTAYEKWNNQRVVPAVHKAEVHIVIKKEELIKFMQDKMKNDFEELCEFCYPEASKQDFCQFVVQLQNDGYFGALPNKLLAEVLAPIAKISVGTARNYLSQS